MHSLGKMLRLNDILDHDERFVIQQNCPKQLLLAGDVEWLPNRKPPVAMHACK
jgi:hypothetical protein